MFDERAPVEVFLSYAHEDELLVEKLEKHLILLQRKGLITAWHDRQIMPGSDWSHTIDHYLNGASIILLLVSPNFLASDNCYNIEMQRALERQRMSEALVIPVILCPVDWHEAPFAHLQCLPRDAKPVTEWNNQDAAFCDIAEGLRLIIEKQRSSCSPLAGRIEDRRAMSNRVKYLKHLLKRFGTVTLPLGPIEGFTLQAIFQPLTLRQDPLAAEDLQREKRRALLGEPIPADDKSAIVAHTSEEALQKSSQKRLVILGGPGTGKTTVLQFLIYEQTRKALVDPAAPLPILVSLPDLARSGKILTEYILRLTKEAGVPDRFIDTLGNAIAEGQAFICLDSLDEVSPDQRPDMIRMINELAAEAGNTWVVGSRFTEYKGGQFKRGGFAEWELQPMTSSLRRELAKRLLPELYCLLQPNLDQAGRNDPLAFVNLLETHTRAAAWSKNPLLFSLAAVVFVRQGTLPKSRAALYQQVVDAVLETREKDLTRRKVLHRVLSDLALGLYIAKGRTFSLDDLLALLPIIRQRHHENWATEEVAQRIINSGMLDILAHETYGFRHQTFQEYLAAAELAQRLVNPDQALRDATWTFVWNKRTYSRWTEVLRLMVGVLVQKHRREGTQKALAWLSELARQQDKPDGDPGHLGLILALKSLAEIAETTLPYWKDVGGNRIEEELVAIWVGRLLNASQQKNITQQRRLGELSTDIVHLKQIVAKIVMDQVGAALRDGDARIRAEAIRKLESLGVCVPTEPLIAVLHDKEGPVRAAAAKTLGVLRERTLVEPLLNVLQDKHEEVRAAAIESLGNLRENAPLEPLLAALHDPAWNVRRAAAEALGKTDVLIPREQFINLTRDGKKTAENMQKHVSLEPLLVALQDQYSEVRAAAARSLGNFGEQMPIAPLLEALSDEEHVVCNAAAQALIKQIERVPVEPLLAIMKKSRKYRYGRDKYVEAHIATLNVLARMGEQAPVDILLSALNEKSERVRQAAIRALGMLKATITSDTILAILNNEQEVPFVRAEAVGALANLGGNRSTTVLLAALNDPVEEVRRTAANSLGKIKTPTLVEQLLATASQNIVWIRLAAVSLLGKLGEHAPIDLLLSLFNDTNEVYAVRVAAGRALIELAEYVPIKTMLAILLHEDARMHQSIAQIFTDYHVFSEENIPVVSLLLALKHDDHDVRWRSVLKLADRQRMRRGRRQPLFPSDRGLSSVAIWLQTCEKLATPVSIELGELLIEVLSDEDVWVYTTAARALGEIGAYLSSELFEKLVTALTRLYPLTGQKKKGRVIFSHLIIEKGREKMDLPKPIIRVLCHFEGAFSERVWEWAKVLLIGAILVPGERTVAAILRVMGQQDEKQFQNYHRVLNRAKWSSREISHILLLLLVALFVKAQDPVVVGVDETIERRRGEQIEARGIYRDPVRSSKSVVVKTSGLRWISMMLLTQVRFREANMGLAIFDGACAIGTLS